MTARSRRLTRPTAARLLSELLERVGQVNGNPYFLYTVQEVVVFGSYLHPTPRLLGDLNIAVRARPRKTEGTSFVGQLRERADISGRHFNSTLQRLTWPLEETFEFLRGGSTAIRIQNLDDQEARVRSGRYEVLFERSPS